MIKFTQRWFLNSRKIELRNETVYISKSQGFSKVEFEVKYEDITNESYRIRKLPVLASLVSLFIIYIIVDLVVRQINGDKTVAPDAIPFWIIALIVFILVGIVKTKISETLKCRGDFEIDLLYDSLNKTQAKKIRESIMARRNAYFRDTYLEMKPGEDISTYFGRLESLVNLGAISESEKNKIIENAKESIKE